MIFCIIRYKMVADSIWGKTQLFWTRKTIGFLRKRNSLTRRIQGEKQLQKRCYGEIVGTKSEMHRQKRRYHNACASVFMLEY